MTSGSTFVRKFDDAVSTLERQLQDTQKKFEALTSEKAVTLRLIGQHFQSIAKIYAHALDTDQLRVQDALSQEALAEMAIRDTDRANLLAELPPLLAQLETRLEIERRAEGERDLAAARVTAICNLVDDRLKSNSEHVALRSAESMSRRRAEIADKKAKAAARERDQKAGAYESDPVYMYLLHRGYGTARYSAWPLTRTVDGWLARLCGFDRASRDHEALTALPGFLADHAKAMEAEANAAGRQVEAARRVALQEEGVESAERELEAKSTLHSRAQADVASVRSKITEIHKAIGRLDEWNDVIGKRLISRLSTAFGAERYEQMLELVATTASVEDDELLRQTARLRGRVEQIDDELLSLDGVIADQKTRLKSLKDVRSRYRSKFNSSDYRINDSRASDLLTGFIAGRVMSDALWSGIERSASYDPPSSSSSSSSSSFGGGGGFSSGGGFGGGGGFSTGGGF